jgi:CO/xanthine dehydrogenase Mo-binding subunit
VLNKAAQASGWGKPLPPRSARGISLHDSFGTHAALVIEVEVDTQGEILLRRATAAVDCGIAVNPDSVIAQIEGGVLFGLSAALYNGITFQNGRVQQSKLHQHPALCIRDSARRHRIELHHQCVRSGDRGIRISGQHRADQRAYLERDLLL